MPDPIFTKEKVEFKKEPQFETDFEYTEENKAAVLMYRKLCRHISKSIAQPEIYFPITYNLEQDELIAYLQTASGPVTKINVTKVIAHLDGRFDTALEGMPEFNFDDGTKFIEVQKALVNQQGSIFITFLSQHESLREQFLKFTSLFWFRGPYHELNGFLWSAPKLVQYMKQPNNFSLLIFMPLAITKYLTITRGERRGRQELLQRAEGEFNVGYKKGLKIRTQFPRSFSQGLPYSMGSIVGKRFGGCEYLLVLEAENQNDYVGAELHSDGSDVGYDSDNEGESEILLESTVILEVLDVQIKPVFHNNQRRAGRETYTEVRVAVRKKPKLTVPDDLAINPAVMSLFSERLESMPILAKRVMPTHFPDFYELIAVNENQPTFTPVVEAKSDNSRLGNSVEKPQPLLPVMEMKSAPQSVINPTFSSSAWRFTAKPADLNAVSAVKLIDLLKNSTIRVEDVLKTIPRTSPVWRHQPLLDIIMLTHKYTFIDWLIESPFFDEMTDANCNIFAQNILSFFEEQDAQHKKTGLRSEHLDWVQKTFINLCKAIAKDNNRMAVNNYNGLLEKLVEILVNQPAKKGDTDILNKEINQRFILPNGVQMRSFTPVQLLVALQQTKALSHIAQQQKLSWNAPVHFNTSALEDEKTDTMYGFAKVAGFKEFAKFQQLYTAKNHLKEIEAERPWIDFGGKQSRIKACNALIQYNQQGTPIPEEHRSVLSSSTLKNIVALNPVVYGSAELTMHL